ncbi:MaoC/PaaZ C-terminal domain-containing protein [Lentibacillus sp. L22]|uniref:MaoC/PaaZ C-terminal domain-containing protein n=1 Tax=Lentibacillus sp. L22 TaxID=3163028 RepID=UPI003466A4FC
MYVEDLQEGDQFPVVRDPEITRVQLVKYAGASGDFNPLHTVEEVGEQAGTGVIAHGMLIMGMASKAVTNWIPRQYIKKYNVRFRKMTHPGEEIEVVGKVLEKKDERIVGEVQARNPEGEVKVAGKFEVELPSMG